MSNPSNCNRRFAQTALPNPHHLPSHQSEPMAHTAVACLIGLDPFAPKGAIGFGGSITVGTAMPEAPIHKHDDLLYMENKVRTSRQSRMSSPAVDSVYAKKCGHAQFGREISRRPDFAHYFRTFFSREDVDHAATLHSFMSDSRVGPRFTSDSNPNTNAPCSPLQLRQRTNLPVPFRFLGAPLKQY